MSIRSAPTIFRVMVITARLPPPIDALAAEGVRFNNCYATDTPCLPSRTAFFPGRFAPCTGAINHGGEYADLPLQGEIRRFRSDFARDALGSALRRAGYHTAIPLPAD